MKKKRYFKSVQADLKSHNKGKDSYVQYAVGELFKAEDSSKPVKLATNSVIHFYDTFEAALNHNSYGEKSVVEVKPLPGETTVQDRNKCGSRYLEFVRKIPKATIERYTRWVKYVESRQDILDNHKLDLIRELQTRHPELILCGSAAVFLLTGKVYERNSKHPVHDLDFITPYYIRIEGDPEVKLDSAYKELDIFDDEGNETAKLGVLKVSHRDKWGSGNDFDEVVYVNNVPVDLAVNPSNKYEYVTFRGFRYKVASLASILEAKLKYANQGNSKHMQDINDLINLPKVFDIV